MNTARAATTRSFTLLQDMGIPVWAKRPARETQLFSLQPKVFARLLIILQKKIEDNTETQKVFLGMLKVLNLQPDEMCVSWCLNDNILENLDELSLDSVYKTLNCWKPQNILVFGQQLGAKWGFPNHNYFVTYHPEELVKFPKAKREAYQVLLSLKACLDRGVPNA